MMHIINSHIGGCGKWKFRLGMYEAHRNHGIHAFIPHTQFNNIVAIFLEKCLHVCIHSSDHVDDDNDDDEDDGGGKKVNWCEKELPQV